MTNNHSVEFYQDDTYLVDSVARFIRDGLQVKSTVLIIGTDQHRRELARVLTPEERSQEMLRFFDAQVLLTTFMIEDRPNESLFRDVVGGMIGEAAQHGPVRVFGEMVAILWAVGHARAALRLEELWNNLMADHSFDLLCAYSLANISKGDTDSVSDISQLHTHVHIQPPRPRNALHNESEVERASQGTTTLSG